MDRCSFSINFCSSSSSCCCIMSENSPSLMIICSFFSRFFTFYSSIWYRAKASWASLEIAALSSGELDMTIAAYHFWGELIYHLLRTYLLQSIFDRQFGKVFLVVLHQCRKDCVVIGSRSTTFNILGCAIDLVDGTRCKWKRKRWFVFYAFLWTCGETDYFRLSCEIIGWLTIDGVQT